MQHARARGLDLASGVNCRPHDVHDPDHRQIKRRLRMGVVCGVNN